MKKLQEILEAALDLSSKECRILIQTLEARLLLERFFRSKEWLALKRRRAQRPVVKARTVPWENWSEIARQHRRGK